MKEASSSPLYLLVSSYTIMLHWIMTLIYFMIVFKIILFSVYYDHMPSIIRLFLYSSMKSYSAYSKDPWVSGGHSKRGAYTLFSCDCTLYSGPCGRS